MDNRPHSDEEKIILLAKQFLQARIMYLEHYNSPINFLIFFDLCSPQLRHLLYMSDRIELEAGLRRRLCAKTLTHEHFLDYHLVGICEDYAEITVYERYDYTLSPTPEMETSEATQYAMAMTRVNGIWLLSDITTDGDFDCIYRDSDVDVRMFLNYPYTDPSGAEPPPILGAFSDLSSLTPGFIKFNTEAALAYAEQYALSYNPLFFSYRGLGGDCQNFASQFVWAALGGINAPLAIDLKLPPMVRDGIRAWYQTSAPSHDPFAHWTVVGRFGSYIATSKAEDVGPIGFVTKGVAFAEAGDLIQVSNGLTWFHTYLVVAHTGLQGERTEKDLWVSAHSIDRNKQWLATLITSALPMRTVHIFGGGPTSACMDAYGLSGSMPTCGESPV